MQLKASDKSLHLPAGYWTQREGFKNLGRWGDKYIWTNHSRMKMRYYRLTESRIKRIIRNPARIEEGILEGAVAAMQLAEGKRYSEIWVMYMVIKSKIKVITAWRYPGRSPARNPVPAEILKEIRNIF